MKRTYTDVPEPRYVERAKHCDNVVESDYTVMKALTTPTHSWTPEEKGLAQKTLGVGNWIEATTISDRQYSIELTENGVYEYFCYVFNDSLPGCYYSNTILYDKAVFNSDACTFVDNLVGEAGTFGQILLIINSTSCYLDVQCNNHAEFGYPERVIFKARKIREI